MSTTQSSRLKLFLYSLAIRDRQILLMHYADGLTPREIAVVLDLGETTIGPILDRLLEQARAVVAADDSPATQAVA